MKEEKLEAIHLLSPTQEGIPLSGSGPRAMPMDEKQYQLLAEGHGALTENAEGKCVHQLFEEQAERTPEAVALVCDNKQLTYQELNRRANQLAHYLVKHGVGPETLVGICMERSLDMVIGLLGILKAGGAYVPLDSDYPKERLAFMIEDSGTRILLTTAELSAKLPTHDALIIQLDRDSGLIFQESDETVSSKATAQNAAYIAYTSGSTGQPKGVILTHSNLSNYIRSIRMALGITEFDLYLHTASFAFASSVRPLMVPLSCGATVLIATHEQIISPVALFDLIKDKGVTILDGVASYLRTITYTLSGLSPNSRTPLLSNNLRLVLSSGEPLSSDIAKTWSREFDHPAQLFNMYGQTEVAGTIAVNAIPRHYDNESKVIPVGHPIPKSQIYVLDASLQPVAKGIVGEVYTGGPAVARGYLNRPKLTAEKFLSNPFSEQAGARIFKTGDLARYLSDGTIEIVGRSDQQVKIRGLRIELGEIEAALKEHHAIREAVVLAKEDQAGEKSLLAYLVAKDGQAPVIEGRKRYRLPNGMAIVQQNNNETDYLYDEIFVNNIYLRNGINLPQHACVVDAGANIGMFSMFISKCIPDARIYAFEPIAPVFDALRINTKLYGNNVKVFQHGVSDAEREETFTYYPRHTMMSGIKAYANAEDEVEVVKTYMHNAQLRGSLDMAQMLEQADDLLAGRFEGESHACRLRRLSDVIREENIEHIDLLKVDVQRAELDALRGLDEGDWKKINQIVMEVHDWSGEGGKGQIDTIVTLLEGHGYETVVEQDELMKGTDRYTLYALRQPQPDIINRQVELEAAHSRLLSDAETPLLGPNELRNYLSKSLPAYMVPSAFVFLEGLPRTPNGKVDRPALPAFNENALQARAVYVAPRTPREEIMAGIWMEVLGVNKVGIHDNFFELGGHSLLATRVVSRVRKVFDVELPVRKLFESPTVAGMSAAVIQVGFQEEKLPSAPAIVSRSRAIPLSFAQQRLWFLDQFEPGNALYNVTRTIRTRGQLKVEALKQALEEIVRRHESLRTTFKVVDGSPVQIISQSPTLELPIADLEHLPAEERKSEARRLVTEEAWRPFDLTRGPLFRASLLRLTEDDHMLLLSMHHIVSDSWSMGIIFKEITSLYEAFSEGQPSPLAELPIQYADYAVWQREQLQGNILEEQLAYWRVRLGGELPVLKLPTDRPRPTVQTHQSGYASMALSGELSEQLKAMAQREGVTLYMLLLAIFQVLLSRYSGQEDIIVGSPIAGRNQAEVEGLIGFFVNTLALRTNLSGNATFREILQRVREAALGAYAHQDVPFEKLVEELQPERSLSYSPIFQAMFSFQNAPLPPVTLAGLSLSLSNFNRETTPVRSDLDLYMGETGEGLSAYLMYSTDLFERGTMRRMGERFAKLAESLVRNPDVSLGELEIKEEIELPGLPVSTKGERRVPLSYHQERLWFIDQFETGNVYETSPVYHNIPLILHFSGPVDVEKLEASINALIERHAALRTRITADDQGFQLVGEEERLKLEVVEMEDGIGARSIDGLVAAALEEARRPFVLERDLLVRAKLFGRAASESVLVITLHHLIADKRSLGIIREELSEIYEARLRGRAPRLPSPSLQYPDYAEWQRGLTKEELEPLLFYWKWQLRGRLAALKLPEDEPRAAVHIYKDARRTIKLGKGVTERLEALGREHDCDLFEQLLVGFQALLHRYSKQQEIVVGISEAGRRQTGTENVVGPIANLVVLRSNLGGKETYESLLAQVKQTVRQARRHEGMPFDKLVQQLKPESDMSRTALFDVLFQFDDQEAESLGFGDAEGRVIETNLGYGKYDLNLAMQREGEGLSGTLVYNAEIYDVSTIEQMIRHLETLLEELTKHPESQIDEVKLLSPSEEQQQLKEWNATQAASPRDKTIAQLFAEQVKRTPERVAVEFNGEQVSYRELNERANQLAHYLQERGVGADKLVGLCLDKSIEMIVAILATVKAGGAYLPMDPAYPQERLRFMVEDSQLAYLISTEALVESVPQEIATTILLDAERERIKSQPQSAPDNNCKASNLIYCIYTSGSTGKPKGVLLEHRNVVRLMVNDQQPFSFNENDVWTMFHSYCFDFSVWEMYGALLYGGKLVIVPEAVMKDPSLFVELLVEQKVTVLNQTPTAFYHLAKEALRTQSALALRYVIFGGEALHPVQLKQWRQAYAGTKLINMYGITETTVHVTFKEITDREVAESRSNIGRPIPTTTTYVMDEKQQLLPVGIAGEICVGGEGVGRGYLGRDELTREKFVANPYQPAERLYRSGDLAKLLPDGELIYLGRIDDQVQIRGFRVELGEIKSHLLEHPQVAEAEVIARESKAESLELVAYVVPRAEISVTALRSHLAETLPFYMVPTAFVMLERLPLTANGKVDRKALPDPDETRPEIAARFVAPRTAQEEVLTKIWAEILGLEEVGVFDNFFELGGHSLMATQVASRVSDAFAIRISLRAFFEQPTVAGLAELVSGPKKEHQETIPAIRRIPRA